MAAVSVLAVCVLAAHASGADTRIAPGVAIGDVKIGMTFTQTKKVLGKPQTVNARRQLAGHRGYIEYGWNYSSVWVGFLNTKGVLHSVLIGTSLAREKTKAGIGVGTQVERLRDLPRMTCFTGTAWVGHPYFDPQEQQGPHCVLARADQRRTIFVLKCIEPVNFGCRKYPVERVIVRTSF
jgi:hypothetical protein